MPDPLVSVVIPAYNAEKTVRNAIDSVLGQTMPDLEVFVVVDDACTDDTRRVVEAVRDPRVRLLTSPRRSGTSGARNIALKQVRGRWLAFVDADDEWVPDRLERLLATVGNDTGFFVADRLAASVPDAQGRLVPLKSSNLPAQPWVEKFDFTDCAREGWGVNTLMVARDALGRHDLAFPEWGCGGDWTFLISKLFASGIKGKVLHRVGYLYRVTGSGHDSSMLRASEEQLKVWEFLARDPGVPEAAKEVLRQQAPGIRKRLVVAALREWKWKKFAHYASESPGDLLGIPVSVFRYLWRRTQYLKMLRTNRAAR